jgi:tetratricopeptide (TPR) repeat protein
MIKLVSILLGFLLLAPVAGAKSTSVKEYDRVFTTYPFSDPDPVPAMSRIYPYFRFDGFTNTPVQKSWKVVELENEWLRVMVLPEIGGKVWAAIDKASGKSFIYFNHVVKFRDISMRGPWTSGGMEFNYGNIGHTPNCSTPVDYLVRKNADGGASVFIGGLELLTRTDWRVEICLPADQACLLTRSFWHNGSGLEQPYYSWANIGIKAAGNLENISPGTHHIFHDGKAQPWPINPENGHNAAWYEQNNFGSYKSYHVLGRFAEFFGGYWHDEDFGLARYAPAEDKSGRKIWIWGQSRQGMIWEKLLSDGDGQYVEIQSGRLYNQAGEDSTPTPFKHREFAPYATDSWTEQWFPVKGTQGFVAASPWGAMNVTVQGTKITARISPIRKLVDKIEFFDGDCLLASRSIELKPLQPTEVSLQLSTVPKSVRVVIGGNKLNFAAGDDNVLSRPVEAPATFDWTSAYGLYVKGKEFARQREPLKAEKELNACLQKDPHFLPALAELAGLANARGDWEPARELARRGLAIDTYDAAANYQFAIASTGLGKNADARDGFDIAALTPGWRAAALTGLAKQYLRESKLERAIDVANKALDSDRRNLDALQVLACANRRLNDGKAALAATDAMLALDPLNHAARFELYRHGKLKRQEVLALLRNELPQETLLELAVWYQATGQETEAIAILELAPPTTEVLYWLAFLKRDPARLAKAVAAPHEFVFPFRAEAGPVFEWAVANSPAWQPRYALALLRWHQGKLDQARTLLVACGNAPVFAPFYALRAQLEPATAEAGWRRAGEIDPAQWRYGAQLAKFLLKANRPAEARTVAADYLNRFPTITSLAVLHVKSLVFCGKYQEAIAILLPLQVIPCEGSVEVHELYRETNLMLALELMKKGEWDAALARIAAAREWPENLGSGKPYPENIDERLEDWLAWQCQLGRQSPTEAKAALDRILAFHLQPGQHGTADLVTAWALRQSDRPDDGAKLLQGWLNKAPASDVAKWAATTYDNQPATLSQDAQDCTARVILAAMKK